MTSPVALGLGGVTEGDTNVDMCVTRGLRVLVAVGI